MRLVRLSVLEGARICPIVSHEDHVRARVVLEDQVDRLDRLVIQADVADGTVTQDGRLIMIQLKGQLLLLR